MLPRRAPLCLAVLALLSLAFRGGLGQEGKSPPGSPQPTRVDRFGDPLPAGALARFGSFRGRAGIGNHLRAACNPARNLLATAGLDPTLHLFDMTSGQRLRSINHDDASAGPIALSPDGAIVAVESRADIRLFDTATGRPLRDLVGHLSRLDALAFSPDGRCLASVEGRDIRIWDPATGKLRRALKPADGYHRFAAFSPDSRLLAVLAEDGDEDKVRLWEIESGNERPALATGVRLGTLAFSPDGKRLATVGDDLCLWELASGKCLRLVRLPVRKDHNRRLRKVAFSPDGRLVATALAQTIRLYEAETGREVRAIQVKPEGFLTSDQGKNLISCLGFSRDGTRLITWASEDRARCWDVATGKEWQRPEGHQTELIAVVPTADGKRVVSWAEDEGLAMWELDTGKPVPVGRLPDGDRPLALYPDGRTVVVVRPGTPGVCLLDAADGKERRHLEGEWDWLRLSPDGKLLATHLKGAALVSLVRVDSGKVLELDLLNQVNLYESYQNFAFAPDSLTVFLVARKGQIQQSEVGTGLVVRTFEAGEERHCGALAVSPDGSLLASVVAARTIRIWNVASGKESLTFEANDGGNVRCLAFSPDNCSLAVGGEDKAVRLWEVASGELRREFEGHQDWVRAVAFTPDGRRLISGSKDWTALVWDVTAATDRLAPRGTATPLAKARLWDDLGGDAPQAYGSICLLARHPETAVPCLKERLKELLAQEAPSVDSLLRRLDSDNFEEREKASAALGQLGKDAEDALHRALAGNPSAEVRLRVERLLEALRDARPTPEQLRLGRVVEVLERIGTPEARELLHALARKGPGSRVPQQARLALRRLERAGKR
jgi:WD40 repeat protein